MMALSSAAHRLISVIIPAYNAAKTLGEQLDALKEQVYDGPWEILVVNNRSVDETVAVVKSYQASMPNLRLVQALNKQGRSYACNVGAWAAHGDALIFCDADDVAAPGWLAALASALETHEVVAGTLEISKLNPRAPWRPNPCISSKQPALNFLPQAPGTNMALSRAAFEAVGGFTEDIPPCEDIDISWRLQLMGYTIEDAPDAVMHIRYRETMESLWKQITIYGECHAFLYRRFAAHGMPSSSMREVVRRYYWLLTNVPRLVLPNRQERAMWVYQAARMWGRLRGSLRYHILYL